MVRLYSYAILKEFILNKELIYLIHKEAALRRTYLGSTVLKAEWDSILMLCSMLRKIPQQREGD